MTSPLSVFATFLVLNAHRRPGGFGIFDNDIKTCLVKMFKLWFLASSIIFYISLALVLIFAWQSNKGCGRGRGCGCGRGCNWHGLISLRSEFPKISLKNNDFFTGGNFRLLFRIILFKWVCVCVPSPDWYVCSISQDVDMFISKFVCNLFLLFKFQWTSKSMTRRRKTS